MSQTMKGFLLGFLLVLFLIPVENGFARRKSSRAQQVNQALYPTRPVYKNANLYYYHLGQRYFSKRNYQLAIRYYSLFVKQQTPVSDYGYYGIARSYKALRQHKNAARYYQVIRQYFPKSQFHQSAIEHEGECYLAMKLYSTLIQKYLPAVKNEKNKASEMVFHYYLGRAYQAINMRSKTVSHYMKAVKKNYKTQDILLYIEKMASNGVLKMKSADILKLAAIYHQGGKYDKSKDLLKKIRLSRGDAHFSWLYLMAVNHLKENNTAKAHQYFRKIIQNYHFHKNIIPVAYEYYQSLEKTQPQIAVKGYMYLVETFNKKDIIPPLKKLVEHYDNAGNYFKRSFYMTRLARFDDWQTVWAYLFNDLNNKRLSVIVKRYPKIIAKLKDKNHMSKFHYWVGLAAYKLKKYSSAKKYFQLSYLGYNHEYYSYKSLLYLKKISREKKIWFSELALQKLNHNKSLRFFSSREYQKRFKASYHPIRKNWQYPNLNRALYLYSARAYNLGDRELTRFLKSRPDKTKYYRGLAQYFYALQRYQQSISYAYRLNHYLNGDEGNNYIAKDIEIYLYPKPFYSTVEAYAKKYKVEPALIMAVMREESRFNPHARSWAGAIGLMQIMPRTGRQLARENRIRRYSLFNANTSIKLGSYYIAQLVGQFKSYSYALAGYNGGPGRIAKMIQNAKNGKYYVLTGEHLVELIPVYETRLYVKKVLTSYYKYRQLGTKIN
ncbi:MAG: transglycosylase SLT domain-containing protein [Spirochaetota bacterium]|nr:transglycosylase SLT domain-containing protein [Spirochaetota bacterium]